MSSLSCRMVVLLTLLIVAPVLETGNAFAQAPRITNEASGLACYDDQHLLEAHNAIGFYKFARVRELIAADQCFAMQPQWRVRVDDEGFVGGANVTILKVWLEVKPGIESRRAWTLAKNISGH